MQCKRYKRCDSYIILFYIPSSAPGKRMPQSKIETGERVSPPWLPNDSISFTIPIPIHVDNNIIDVLIYECEITGKFISYSHIKIITKNKMHRYKYINI